MSIDRISLLGLRAFDDGPGIFLLRDDVAILRAYGAICCALSLGAQT